MSKELQTPLTALSFDPPLPCGLWQRQFNSTEMQLCDQPATTGVLTPFVNSSARWGILPVCKSHASEMFKAYFGANPSQTPGLGMLSQEERNQRRKAREALAKGDTPSAPQEDTPYPDTDQESV